MQPVKASTATFVRFVMVDSAGAAVTTLTSGTTTVEFSRPGETALTAAAKTSFAHIGKGVYQVQLSSVEVGATVGHFVYVATGGAALQFTGELNVTANLNDDLSASIAAVNALVDTVEAAQATAASNLTTILSRLGSFTGSGVNTILGFFQALMRNNATLPSDAGGTYDATKHSVEAIRTAVDKARRGMLLVAIRGTTLYARTWLLAGGQVEAGATASRLTVYNEDGSVKIATVTDAAADAQGMFLFAIASHGLVENTNYMAKVEIDSPNGNVVTMQGFVAV